MRSTTHHHPPHPHAHTGRPAVSGLGVLILDRMLANRQHMTAHLSDLCSALGFRSSIVMIKSLSVSVAIQLRPLTGLVEFCSNVSIPFHGCQHMSLLYLEQSRPELALIVGIVIPPFTLPSFSSAFEDSVGNQARVAVNRHVCMSIKAEARA